MSYEKLLYSIFISEICNNSFDSEINAYTSTKNDLIIILNFHKHLSFLGVQKIMRFLLNRSIKHFERLQEDLVGFLIE